MNLASRNSRATGPNIRVPLGLLSSRINTAAFSSNLIYEPSVRRAPVLVRTITALAISPFLTTPPGVASCTAHTTMSPILACILPERSEEHTSELQSRGQLVCRLLLEQKKR